MKSCVLDIEGTAILPTQRWSEKIHCIGCIDVGTKEYSFFRGDAEGLRDFQKYISDYEVVIGHNILGYDNPTLKHHCPDYNPKETRDTLLLSRIIFGDISLKDKKANLEKKFRGKFSLDAWGTRFGFKKIDYYAWCKENGIEDPWAQYTPFMGEYMERDVRLTLRLYQVIASNMYPELLENYQIDHEMSEALFEIKDKGVDIDVPHAEKLLKKMQEEVQVLREQVCANMKPMTLAQKYNYSPKPQKNKRYSRLSEKQKKDFGYHIYPPKDYNLEFFGERFVYATRRLKGPVTWDVGTEVCKLKFVDFNPTSRQHVSWYLIKNGWKPSVFSDSGAPSITYEVLEGLKDDFPIAEPLYTLFMLSKRISFLYNVQSVGKPSEKSSGVLAYTFNGQAYPSITHYGASMSGRCSHSQFNISQTPSVDVKDKKLVLGIEGGYGVEIRQCVYSGKDPDYVLVGSDISGLETALLSHHLKPYDGGEFLEKMSNPDFDIHTENQEIVKGLARYFKDEVLQKDILEFSRGVAKNVYYAEKYGATGGKIGKMVLPLASVNIQKKLGIVILNLLQENIKGMKQLLSSLRDERCKNGNYLMAFDRRVPCDQDRLALNRLMQGGGARVGTYWVTFITENLRKLSGRSHLIIFSHDEVQIKTHKDEVDQVRQICEDGISYAQKSLGINVDLRVETKVGKNWADTH